MARGIFMKSLSGEGFLGLARFGLVALDDAILPPFTSRTWKSVLWRSKCLSDVYKLYESRERFKPVTIRVLKTTSGRPLYRVADGRDRPITVSRGHELLAELGFAGNNVFQTITSAVTCSEEVDVEYARFIIEPIDLETRMVHTLNYEDFERVVIDIVTPMTISTKIMSPPVRAEKLSTIISRTREAYRLLPTPSYILSQAAREWIALIRGSEPNTDPIPYAIGRLADVMVAEVHFDLKPTTVLYGKENGKEARVRGVRGRIVLEPLNSSIKPAIHRLLTLASYIGLGKSRSIGFGEVRVSFRRESSQ